MTNYTIFTVFDCQMASFVCSLACTRNAIFLWVKRKRDIVCNSASAALKLSKHDIEEKKEEKERGMKNAHKHKIATVYRLIIANTKNENEVKWVVHQVINMCFWYNALIHVYKFIYIPIFGEYGKETQCVESKRKIKEMI